MGFKKYHHKKNKKPFRTKTFVFLCFVFVLGLIVITSMYGGGGITGNVVSSLDKNNSVEIQTSLFFSEISLDGEYPEVIIFLDKGSFLDMGDKRIDFDNSQNRIVLNDFKGEVEINKRNIQKLEGKVSKITFNNIPVNLQKGGKIKVSLSPDTGYSFFEINKGVYLKEFSLITSGEIISGKDSLVLDSEKVFFRDYFGGLRIEEGKLIFDGLVKNLEIQGDSRKLILSK
jgi:hypothetical protein